jgi:hypothetical protein
MKPLFSKLGLLMPVICVFLLQGCATTPPNLDLTRSNLEPVKNITVVHQKTPPLQVYTASGDILILCSLGIVCLPCLIAGVVIDSNASSDARRGVPDYGELMANDFVRIAGEAIPGWPPTTAVDAPVKPGYTCKEGPVLVLDIRSLDCTHLDNKGLVCVGDAIMNTSTGQTIFRRHFSYASKLKQAELLANNHKLLLEEIPIAAETEAKELVQCLKSSLGTANKTNAADTTMLK